MALVPPTSVGGSSSGGVVAQVYDNVAGGAIASWDVTAIAATYTHLQLVICARGDTAATTTTGWLRFNGDTGANYGWQNAIGSNVSVAAFSGTAQTRIEVGAFAAGTATANFVSVRTIIVPNYAATTFHKQVTSVGYGAWTAAVADYQERIDGGFWNSTAAINQVTVQPSAGNWAAGSRLTIYGLT